MLDELGTTATNQFYIERQNETESNARSYPRKFPFALKTAKGSWITDVEGDVSRAVRIESLNYRNTVFRNPIWQSNNPYDSITSGDGMGITVRAISSSEFNIINDTNGTNIKLINGLNKLIE